MPDTLKIEGLHVSVDDKEILKGVDLEICSDEVHALMGPNGNGKSTLLMTIMGHPRYKVTSGKITFNGEDLLAMSVDERSKAGLFLGMQHPGEISGVTNSDFLKAAINARRESPISLFSFYKEIEGGIKRLKMKDDLAHRFVNDGFSGGEKKRNEILQMLMLRPKIAMLDEIDSGLDVDAIKIVADTIIEEYDKEHFGLVIVSHYDRFFKIIRPTHCHVIVDGRIVVEGDNELVEKIDTDGYDWLYQELQIHPVRQASRPLVYSLGTCAINQRSQNG